MEKLRELINIVNKNKIKSIGIIGKSSNSNTLIDKFYNAIHDQKVNSDEDALALLYGNTSDKKAYYKLKHTLKDRLINTLFLVDVKGNKYNNRKTALLECQKGMMAINHIIRADTGRKTVRWLAEKLLKTAMHWTFPEIVISLAIIIRGFHATKSGSRKQFEKYNQIVSDYQELLMAELTLTSKYHDLLCYYVNDKSTKVFIYDIAEKHLEAIKHLDPKVKSSKFFYQKGMIEISKYMSINDYNKTLSLCKTILKNLDEFHYQDVKAIIPISYQFVMCCIQLKKHEQGKEQIEKVISIQAPNTFNWFKAHELYINLSFHSKQYDTAWEIYNKVSTNKKFVNLPKNVKEVWKIYEAWLYFIFQMGKIKESETDKFAERKFRISRFVNEMNIYNKDKKGLNIPILIIHTILLLMHKKYDVLIDRVEAISKYTDRYIKKMENQRSNIFIRMILEIPKNDFRKDLIENKTKKYLVALKNIPIDISEQNHDVEILPFEDTWELIMDMMNEKHIEFPYLKRG